VVLEPSPVETSSLAERRQSRALTSTALTIDTVTIEAEALVVATVDKTDASTDDELTQRSSEDRCDDLEWPATPTSVSSRCCEEWVAPLDTTASTCLPQDCPPLAPSTCFDCMYSEAPDANALLTAVDPNVHIYQPILSADGQQLYTDGEQVYMMACMETIGSQEASAEPVQLIHPIMDPYDPINQMMHGLCSASMPLQGDGWPTDTTPQEDGLWDMPWGDVF